MFKPEGLKQFVRRGEKSIPPVFVGRERILGDILAIADEVWLAESHALPGVTRILQGAPGAGKSATLTELARGHASASSTSHHPRILSLNSADISNPGDILVPLAHLVNSKAAPEFLSRIEKTRVAAGGVDAFGVRAGGRLESTLSPPDPRPALMEFGNWARSLDPGIGIAGPIIIAIDEAQRFQRNNEDPLAKLLQGLHDSTSRLPLTLVLAGLSDTADRARDMGLTRGLEIHMIGALHPDNVTRLMTGFCHRFGMDPRGHEARLTALAAPCEGWPRHLHAALAALAAAALTTEGDLDRIDWDRVEAAAAAGRHRYYQGQRSSMMEESAGLVASVLRDLRPGHRRSDVIDSIRDHVRRAGPDAPTRMQLPAGMTPRALADHLIHQGALQETPDHAITCPIPSFRQHLIEEGGMSCGDGQGVTR